MKSAAVILSFIFASLAFFSCKKENEADAHVGFIKSIKCDSSAAVVGNILLPDNNIIIVCRSMDKHPGYLYKMDSNGKLIWEKRLNDRNIGCYLVYDLPGNGFAVLGYENSSDTFFQVFVYDDDGNFLQAKSIPYRLFSYGPGYFPSMQMLQLSNGNFVFAYNWGDLMMCYTNSSFDTLYYKTAPLIPFPGSLVTNIYQNTDSTILFANIATQGDGFISDFDYDIHFITTDLSGNFISHDSIADAKHNETPNTLLPFRDKLLMISGRMGILNQSSGAMISYYDNSSNYRISAEINVLQLAKDGRLLSRISVKDYPGNGMVFSGRPTSDGGYILCGTVDQSDQVYLVSPTKIFLMKIDADGRYEWSRYYKTTYPSIGIDVVQTSDGGYFITGYEKSFDRNYNALVIKTGADGNY